MVVEHVFSGRYGEAVHGAWPEAGLAPALHDVTRPPGGMPYAEVEMAMAP